MSVQKPGETADRDPRDAGAPYPREVLRLDAGRTSFLSAEQLARLALDDAPRLDAHPETPVGTPKGPASTPPATPVGTPKAVQGKPPATPVGTPKSARGSMSMLGSPKSAQGTPTWTPRR
jgi:hypothetical protein